MSERWLNRGDSERLEAKGDVDNTNDRFRSLALKRPLSLGRRFRNKSLADHLKRSILKNCLSEVLGIHAFRDLIEIVTPWLRGFSNRTLFIPRIRAAFP
jgi:hypothetical protein